ncbi:MAG: hypothetical protein RDU76_00820 [Candidatus Edwardsbacteria bacterium]|nr:hypothetical protein [Candidatus Edwardsbacteria bacterium]
MEYYRIPAWSAVIIAALMHLYNIAKSRGMIQQTRGIIRTSRDLQLVREVINLSMQLAIYYIAMSLLLLAVLAYLVISGLSFITAMGQLFLFGIITLPMGLIGKHFEDRVRRMEIQPPDPVLQETYSRYLAQWKEPRFKLPD